ncbi:putative ribonuclease H-like domain-containing protein [Tanacetum coccineum]|uniref:Ribonuclease H-like domain-containing protein n=1 Tax=Tanacetum coccineum TaxID=301880 RepID=A0ABQ5AFP8_9ASTR
MVHEDMRQYIAITDHSTMGHNHHETKPQLILQSPSGLHQRLHLLANARRNNEESLINSFLHTDRHLSVFHEALDARSIMESLTKARFGTLTNRRSIIPSAVLTRDGLISTARPTMTQTVPSKSTANDDNRRLESQKLLTDHEVFYHKDTSQTNRPKKIVKSIWVKKGSTIESQAVLPQTVKKSAMINPKQTWRPKGNYLDSVNRDNGSYTLKQFWKEDLKDIKLSLTMDASRKVKHNLGSKDIFYCPLVDITCLGCNATRNDCPMAQKTGHSSNYKITTSCLKPSGSDHGTEFKNQLMNEFFVQERKSRENIACKGFVVTNIKSKTPYEDHDGGRVSYNQFHETLWIQNKRLYNWDTLQTAKDLESKTGLTRKCFKTVFHVNFLDISENSQGNSPDMDNLLSKAHICQKDVLLNRKEEESIAKGKEHVNRASLSNQMGFVNRSYAYMAHHRGSVYGQTVLQGFEDPAPTKQCLQKFKMSTRMGELTFFLGLQVKQTTAGIFLSQDKYVKDILNKFDFRTIKPASTPIEAHKSLGKDEEGEDVDVHLYRSMIGCLMYLTASRPDIMFAVCLCARFQVTPKVSHIHAVKRIFRYLKHQPKLGLWYPKDSPFHLEAFSDSDYAGDNHDRRSTSGGCQYLGRRLVSWQCKKQTIVAISSTEAEYVAAASCCAQVLWMQNQLLDYGFNFMNTEIHIDNESTICIVKNPVFHSKTKHIQIRHHFIRDCYEQRLINVVKVHTDDNVADLLTKGFDLARFNFLVVTIGMMNP